MKDTIERSGGVDGSAGADADMPEEVDFSRAVRGKEGRALLMRMMRYREALQEISAASNVVADPLAAALEMKERARSALGG